MNQSNSGPIRGPLPPVYLLVAIILMVVLHLCLPIVKWISFPWRYLGAVLAIGGFSLVLWVARLFKSAGTAIKPTESSTVLVLKGPYIISRNPIYLGMVLLLSGIAMMFGSVTPWLVIPVFVWQITQRFIVFEERKLESAFGSSYLEYKAKVRRWI